MKILVIFTGGTIGSTVKDGYVSPDKAKKFRILEDYKQLAGSGQLFDTLAPYTVLSENLNGEHISMLMETVNDNLDKYDGIIVTHGTDTIQYSAAALTYAFGMDTIPIVFVSSNRVIEDKSANGIINFKRAVDFICNKCGRGVYVSYRNDNDVERIHVGNQLLPHQMYDEALYSVGNNYYGHFENDTFIKNDGFIEPYILKLGVRNLTMHSPVMIIQPYVGIRYLKIPDYVKVILFTTYHSGTINTASDDIKKLSLMATEKKKKLKLIGFEESTAYESVKEYKKLGIEILPKGSSIAAYMKIWMEESDGRQ